MDALYRDYILDHYKNPRNFGELEPHDLEFHDHNPLCGDELGVHIVVEDGKVAELRFHGQGCAISQAAASISSEELIGMDVSEVPELSADWIRAAFGIVRRWPRIYALGWIHLYDDPSAGTAGGLLDASGRRKPGYDAFRAG